MSTPRYVTVDFHMNILEVMHLRDQFDHPTEDPKLAERCIVKCQNGALVAMTTDEVPIYTVH